MHILLPPIKKNFYRSYKIFQNPSDFGKIRKLNWLWETIEEIVIKKEIVIREIE